MIRLIYLKTEYLDISELSVFESRVKTLSEENFFKLKDQIIKRFAEPLLVWEYESKKYILHGLQRYRVLKKLHDAGESIPKIPCSFVECSSREEANELFLSLISQYGTIETNGLFEFLTDNRIECDFFSDHYSMPEIDIEDLRLKFAYSGMIEETAGDDSIPDIRDSPSITEVGDLWELNGHRLSCGDATKQIDVGRLLNGKTASMVFTDPPYNVNYEASGKQARSIMNDNLGNNFSGFLTTACSNLLEVCSGAIYICMSSSELATLQKAFIEAGGHWSTFIIWAKDTFTLGRSDYQRQYEPILYGWKEGNKHHWCGDRNQGDVWQFPKPRNNDIHPTMKPVELVQRAIENSSKMGDVVLDCFGGSGSTLIASEKSHRKCYIQELDPHYCDMILLRFIEFMRSNGRETDIRKNGYQIDYQEIISHYDNSKSYQKSPEVTGQSNGQNDE